MVAYRVMDAYTEYKARSAELLVERAFNVAWTPEAERAGEEDLQALWGRLTPDERLDVLAWLRVQEAASSVEP